MRACAEVASKPQGRVGGDTTGTGSSSPLSPACALLPSEQTRPPAVFATGLAGSGGTSSPLKLRSRPANGPTRSSRVARDSSSRALRQERPILRTSLLKVRPTLFNLQLRQFGRDGAPRIVSPACTEVTALTQVVGVLTDQAPRLG